MCVDGVLYGHYTVQSVFISECALKAKKLSIFTLAGLAVIKHDKL